MDTFFTVGAIVFAVLLLPRVARLFWRMKIADGILARTHEQREALMCVHRSMLTVMRLFVWLIPVVLVLLAASAWLLRPDFPRAIFVVIAEWVVWVLSEYSFAQWLVRYVDAREPAAPT